MNWARKAMEFVGQTLPNLLGNYGEGNEDKAFAAMLDMYREHREHEMKDRTGEMKADRIAVDTLLAEREASEAKKASSGRSRKKAAAK